MIGDVPDDAAMIIHAQSQVGDHAIDEVSAMDSTHVAEGMLSQGELIQVSLLPALRPVLRWFSCASSIVTVVVAAAA